MSSNEKKKDPVPDLARLMDAISHEVGDHHVNMRRDRPYNGQSWTDSGIRGKTEIQGITFRDLKDCFLRAICLCAGGDDANLPYYREAEKGEHAALCWNDIYELKGEVSFQAVSQSLACEVEKIMGIYPNTPKMSFEETMKEVPMLNVDGTKGKDYGQEDK